jgi:glyoxylase-like metal-dependent hydrolase (beta-lactamase superfamily II)
MDTSEVAPGVYRLAFAVGAKPMAMYLLAGDGLILVDSGLPDTPETVYLPAIEEIGRRPEEVRLLVITHADADHIGGNAAARRLFPHALIACHALDRRWSSDPAVLTAERYDGFVPYGLRYEQEVFDVLGSWMGTAEPMDLLLQEGVGIRLAGDEWLTVRHVPSHTPGHICLHNPDRGYALIGDAVFGESQLDAAGGKAAAPPYTDVAAYRATIRTLESLDLDLLLTCHYPVMRGAEVRAFLAASRAWCDRAEAVTARLLREADGPLTLAQAIERADPLLGPFAAPRELQWALLAHLDHAVAKGEAAIVDHGGAIAWRWAEQE